MCFGALVCGRDLFEHISPYVHPHFLPESQLGAAMHPLRWFGGLIFARLWALVGMVIHPVSGVFRDCHRCPLHRLPSVVGAVGI